MTKRLKLRVAHLYPKQMNIYGDRGNILCLQRRCRQRSIDFEVNELEIDDKLAPKDYDLIFIGGAQDREQRRVAVDLVRVKGKPLAEAVNHNVAVLAVCGGLAGVLLAYWLIERVTALRKPLRCAPPSGLFTVLV